MKVHLMIKTSSSTTITSVYNQLYKGVICNNCAHICTNMHAYISCIWYASYLLDKLFIVIKKAQKGCDRDRSRDANPNMGHTIWLIYFSPLKLNWKFITKVHFSDKNLISTGKCKHIMEWTNSKDKNDTCSSTEIRNWRFYDFL